jgi:hypothetical protein
VQHSKSPFWSVLLPVAGFGIYLLSVSPARTLSLYIDFDGSGFGVSGSSGTVPSASGVCVNCQNDHSSRWTPSYREDYDQLMANYERDRLAQQKKEEEEREKLRAIEEKQRQLEEQIRRNSQDQQAIQQLSQLLQQYDSITHVDTQRERYQLKLKIDQALTEFERLRTAELKKYNALTNKVTVLLDQGNNVPLPPTPPTYDSVLLLGMFADPKLATSMKADSTKNENPFTGKQFTDVVAFGDRDFDTIIHSVESRSEESARVFLDHALANFDILSPITAQQLSRLRGAHIRELVVHSNGATIAEVLIRQGWIRVDTLRVLGGDRTLVNPDSLKELAQQRGVKISVYAIHGDAITMLPTGWKLREWADKLYSIGGKLPSYEHAPESIFDVLGLSRQRTEPGGSFEMHLITSPYTNDKDYLERHYYETYRGVIKGQRLQGCLDGSGALDRRCVIQ